MYKLPKTWLAVMVALSVLFGSIQPIFADSGPEQPTFGFTTMWASKYVSEGRDNLGNGGIFSFEATAELQGLTTGASLATGDRGAYEELNLFVAYNFKLKPVDVYFGYTRLEFLDDDESDNEINAGFAVNSIPYVVPALDYTYSKRATGGLLECSLRSEIEFLNGQLTLEPYILEGFDFGYASDEYDGPNNFQLGIDFAFAVSDPIKIVGSVAHSWAHKDVENDGLGDVSWITIGFSTVF